MGFKTLLSVVTDGEMLTRTLDNAVALAAGFDAHLDVLCLGVDRTQTGYYYAGANAMVLQETLTRATAEADELASAARVYLGKTDIRWGVDHGVAQLADIGRHVAARARFSDLVVLPKPYGEDRGIEPDRVYRRGLSSYSAARVTGVRLS